MINGIVSKAKQMDDWKKWYCMVRLGDRYMRLQNVCKFVIEKIAREMTQCITAYQETK